MIDPSEDCIRKYGVVWCPRYMIGFKFGNGKTFWTKLKGRDVETIKKELDIIISDELLNSVHKDGKRIELY